MSGLSSLEAGRVAARPGQRLTFLKKAVRALVLWRQAGRLTVSVARKAKEKHMTDLVSRRSVLMFLGLSALAVAAPVAVSAPAEAQSTGTERRQDRRSGRTARRQNRRIARVERRDTRREGREERRSIRQEGQEIRRDIRQGM
jgi:hypothetical protein